tara:strand:- start:2187 stop:2696 length:510 start_codon:yes stop_codon:yes gene_type:complete
MRHYELVLIVHPDQSDQVSEMLNRYQETIKKANGNIHRVEDIGRLQLAYTIENMHKAHYVLLNIECDDNVINELENSFKFNDSIMRHLLVKTAKAETEPSKLFLANNKESDIKKKESSRGKTEGSNNVQKESIEAKAESVKEDRLEKQPKDTSEETEEKMEEEDEKIKE